MSRSNIDCLLFVNMALPLHLRRLLLLLAAAAAASLSVASTILYDFKIQYVEVTRICHTKTIISVNGQFPGPTMFVNEGDDVEVNITNLVENNVTIHWHGVKQLLSAWADDPAQITQCPIQTGKSFVHRFKIVDQRGTLFWHAHISWLRATLHGAFIIRPKDKIPYKPAPKAEIPIILGEWWIPNVEDVIAEALRIGGPFNASDALTINGQPGLCYNCSLEETTVIEVEDGETYLLQMVNAALNAHLYVGVEGHELTVVNVDAEYTEAYTTDIVFLAPGQTMEVLLTANNRTREHYILAASVYSLSDRSIPTPTAVIRYNNTNASSSAAAATLSAAAASLRLPSFPAFDDSLFVFNFSQSLRSLNNTSTSTPVPLTIDENLFFTVGYAAQTCPTCSFRDHPGLRLAASINNVTFSEPSLSLLQAYYYNGTYDPDFPSVPLFQYNYTGLDLLNNLSVLATKVKMLDFGAKVQLVLQNTATRFIENHPIHLHGHNFYIVGSGFGNFNESADTPNFILDNPVFRNTAAVPAGGWVALRFTADNPGAWFMHCHFDFHTSIGMSMAFITKNGNGTNETLPPPPSDLPPC